MQATNQAPVERPGFLTAGIILNALNGALLLFGGCLGFPLGLVALIAAASDSHGDEEAVVLAAAGFLGAVVLTLLVVVGLLTLLVSYKALCLGRPWVWSLVVLSVIGAALTGWGAIAAGVTIVGAIQTFDRQSKVGQSKVGQPEPGAAATAPPDAETGDA